MSYETEIRSIYEATRDPNLIKPGQPKGYQQALQQFIRLYCAGKEYDSCKNSPCPHASPDGCRHEMHPLNRGWEA